MSRSKNQQSLKYTTLTELTDAVAESIIFKMLLQNADIETLRPDGSGWRLCSKMAMTDNDATPAVIATYASKVNVVERESEDEPSTINYTLLAHQDDIIHVVLAAKMEAELEQAGQKARELLDCLPPERHKAIQRGHHGWYILRTRVGHTNRVWGGITEVPDPDPTKVIELYP